MPDRIAIGLNIIPNPHPTDEHHRKAGNKRRMARSEADDRMRQRRKGRGGEDNNPRMGRGNHGIDN